MIEKYSKYIFLILISVLTVSCVHRTISNNMDFIAFHRTALLFLSGNIDFYNIARDHVFTFKYGPVFPLITFPIGYLSFNTAKVIWALINAASLILAWIYSEKLIRLSLSEIKITYTARLLTLLMILDIVSRNAMQGNINVMLFAAIIISVVYSLEGKNKRAALIAAIAASIKITPGILLVFFLVSKNKKAFWYSVVFGVLILLVTVFTFGFENSYNMYLSWQSVLSDTAHFPFYKHTNQSPVAVLYHITGSNKFAVSVLLTFAVACTWFILRSYLKKDIFGMFTGSMLAYLSLSPIVWIEYHVVMLPILLATACMFLQKQLNRTASTLFVLRFILVHIFVTAIVGEKLGITTAMLGQHLIGSWLLGAVYYFAIFSTNKKS